jgi:hypothetical protein
LIPIKFETLKPPTGGTDKTMDFDEPSHSEDKIFQKLATFVLGRLTIAHSTAAVERTFSIVSCVKTKARNRMVIETLESVLRLNLQLCLLNLNYFSLS